MRNEGAAAQYLSWRWFQTSLGVLGLMQMILVYVLFLETAHPDSSGVVKRRGMSENGRPSWINPFSCLYVFRSPVFVTLVSTLPEPCRVDYTDYRHWSVLLQSRRLLVRFLVHSPSLMSTDSWFRL